MAKKKANPKNGTTRGATAGRKSPSKRKPRAKKAVAKTEIETRQAAEREEAGVVTARRVIVGEYIDEGKSWSSQDDAATLAWLESNRCAVTELDDMHRRLAARVEAEINSRYANREFATLDETQLAIKTINAWLRRHSLKLLCPNADCFRAATLKVQKEGTVTGAIKYRHGRITTHGGAVKLAEVRVRPDFCFDPEWLLADRQR